MATFAGSVYSYFFAKKLIKNFLGKGLVPDEIIGSVAFVLAVALGAALTVLLATRYGFPVSTTHGLVGALVGAGLVAVGPAVNFAKLGTPPSKMRGPRTSTSNACLPTSWRREKSRPARCSSTPGTATART